MIHDVNGVNVSLVKLNGQCPDFAHARASSVFFLFLLLLLLLLLLLKKDNITAVLTRHDFLRPDRTADGDLLFTFLSNM